MLPVVATMVMGGFEQEKCGRPRRRTGRGRLGLLGSLLDQNRDGSVADDVVGMLGRFLGGR